MKPKLQRRIVLNPAVMRGKPVIRGTRIPVDAVITRLADGMTEEEILRDLPALRRADVRAALAYSAAIVQGEDVTPVVLRRGKRAAAG